MIHSLTGTVLETPKQAIILDTGHNCSYLVHALDVDRVHGLRGRFYVHFHLRQDQMTLFGFLEDEVCKLFKRLLDVKGCGPKTALNILNHSPHGEVIRAIQQQEETSLLAIPGIGKRMAAQILIDLKGKLTEFNPSNNNGPKKTEIIQSLTRMGYSQWECERVYLDLNLDTIDDEAKLIRLMLQHLKKDTTL